MTEFIDLLKQHFENLASGLHEQSQAETNLWERALSGDYPSATDIGTVMSHSPMMGMGAGTIRGTRILVPAVKVSGRLFAGLNHAEAAKKAAKATGLSVDKVLEKIENRGFLTNVGEFVGPRDASFLALDQIEPKLSVILRKQIQQGRVPGLVAEMLPKKGILGRESGLLDAISQKFSE